MWSSTPRLILGLYGLLCAVGSASADVDFMSVRPDMVKDYSGKGGEPGEKYFKESRYAMGSTRAVFLLLSLTNSNLN
ncbi:mannosyltransferase [Aspergillus tubingensis]